MSNMSDRSDNVAPMLDELPDPEQDNAEDHEEREARVSERDAGANEEKIDDDAELRDDE